MLLGWPLRPESDEVVRLGRPDGRVTCRSQGRSPRHLRCLGVSSAAILAREGEGMHQVLFGTALLVSFLGGVVALLAPCCVSVMLPAYFATGFGRRSGIAAATAVFAAGVATLIVPIGLGASALSAALPAHHLLIFTIGGPALLARGGAGRAGSR